MDVLSTFVCLISVITIYNLPFNMINFHLIVDCKFQFKQSSGTLFFVVFELLVCDFWGVIFNIPRDYSAKFVTGLNIKISHS